MSLFAIFISIIFVLLIFFVVRKIHEENIVSLDDQLREAKSKHQKLAEEKGNVYYDLNQLEGRAREIFVLYEMTKEITKSVSEQEAFEIFRSALSQNVSFKECRLIMPDSEELEQLKEADDSFLIPIRGGKQVLSFVCLRSVILDDKDKIVILVNQFALALQRIRLYLEVEKLAITDSLTEVYTRRCIMERFAEEIKRAELIKIKLAFLMIDVDFFKRFNDRYGHLAGDRILSSIANIVNQNIREIDIIGRYGGEEFCVILPETDRKGANYVAERIRAAVESAAIHAYDSVVRATISIGLSIYPDDGDSCSEILDKADWALYRAKNLGRNTVCSFDNSSSNL